MGRVSELARHAPPPLPPPLPPPRGMRRGRFIPAVVISAVILLGAFPQLRPNPDRTSPYGIFPSETDPFHLIPCTPATLPPPLDDSNPGQAWASRFDRNPSHWSWASPRNKGNGTRGEDPYAGRGIYMCGYLDVPLDYTNKSDSRIARLAVTRFRVSGLARVGDKTIAIEPGGPGGSGTLYAWRAAETISARFSDGKFDVLGWDPRSVNASLPAIACCPNDASRDRWSRLTSLHYTVSASPRQQLELVDAMNAAVIRACWERHGDLGRFVGTGMVARDPEQIRIALGEDELTGYLVGRLILDGTECVRDHRLRGGFGWTALDYATDAWHDGFLGECVNAGPMYCALAKPTKEDGPATHLDLEARMDALVASLAYRPVPAYLPTSGPTLVTYSHLCAYELEGGNLTLAAPLLETSAWWYDPEAPSSPTPVPGSDNELGNLVICADSFDVQDPDDLDRWLSLWGNMTTGNWIAGNSRMYGVLPCRHFLTYWPQPVGVYRGDLNHTLRHPVLLIAETYDPATPLGNGRRLLQEMGWNARLIVHHGYGHSSRDTSNCTETMARAFILDGTLPEEQETDCYADEKPYLYGVEKVVATALPETKDPAEAWQGHLVKLSFLAPQLLHAM
ncbi:hypothetical protein N657DRAFT_663378 [Parathielavia appendiculata]|uniref:Peptidase S33 tripeptidyl aminopeptidase-like C-terminal domain-containing protein n=1 Tax=Parathielavia appendiculata TaxID=2587402 RepID=A0AAN6U0N9_9PEZI|nr:hypothetical protein N657DRAFT_663378 [Parathielavia appendiculata]